ncbi:MAG TPA: hypothetical protein VIP09_07210 [Dehalococcoidia bacterium]|jgi:hypothetical protein
MNEDNLYSLRAEPSEQFRASLWQRLSAQPAAEKRPSRAPRLAMGLAVAVAAVGLLAWTPATRAAIDGVLSETAGVKFWESNTSNPIPPADVTSTTSGQITETKLTFDEAVAQIAPSMVRPPQTLGDYTAASAYGLVGVRGDGSVASYDFLYFGPGDASLTFTAETNPGVWLTGIDSVREVTVAGRYAAIVQGGWTTGDLASGADPNVKVWDPSGASIALVWVQGGVQYTLSGRTQYVAADDLARIAGEVE